ncbi:MAG: 3-phosphoshikimate 1-carboxyvinyltransferase [Oscillospiraceae bacterium]|nr:3-phosphoshikimate 1-carboxyvinyltransferase [Oscillospiraceae bacterium]
MSEQTVRTGERSGEVRIPSSKSVVHRLLICAALGEKPVRIRLRGLSDDILATADCLRALGAEIQTEEGALLVSPVPQASAAEGDTDSPGSHEIPELPCRESGSTLRFLLPVAGALGREVLLKMEGRLPQRPLAPFDRVLAGGGMEIRREGDRLHCSGALRSGNYDLPGNVSSQFFSGLLMALPRLEGESRLRCQGELESADYLGITESVLQEAGIVFRKPEQGTWLIPGRQNCALPETVQAEGDWSSVAFFLSMGALSEKGILVRGLRRDSGQGDRRILDCLRDFGASVELREDGILARSVERRPFRLDAGPVPDLVPVLAVLACAARGDTVISNASRLRLKESDRLRTTAALIRSLGGKVTETEDGLIVHGTGRLAGGGAEACGDHRIAMSAAVAAVIAEAPVTVHGAQCVSKSYPGFWEDLEAL